MTPTPAISAIANTDDMGASLTGRGTPTATVIRVNRYVIIGAGAVGAGIGARLQQSGVEVVLVARGPHLLALSAQGLRLCTPEEDVRLSIPAVSGPDQIALRPGDVLVLATKTHQAQDALIAWADAPVRGGGTAGERLPLLTALNGVVSEDLASRYFARVYGVCVWMWAAHLDPGEVIIEGVPNSGLFHLGRVPAALADDTDQALLSSVKADWDAARLPVVLPRDVMEWKYRKLLSNLGNGFQALLGHQPGTGALVKRAVAEGRRILDAAGIAYTGDADAEVWDDAFTIKPVPGHDGVLGGSTWQSLTRGTGNVETDYLNGEILRVARRHGLEAPINAVIASRVRQAAATGAQPGDLTVDALTAALPPD